MELRRLLALIRQRTLLVAVIVIAGLAAGYLTTSRTAVYQASTTIFVGQPATNVSADAQTGQQLLATTFATIVATPKIAEAAVETTHVDRSAGQAVSATSATVITGTNLIRVTVSDPDPIVAATLANGMSQAFVAEVKAVDPLVTLTGAASSQPPATITQDASIPAAPESDGLTRNLALGGVFGLLVGVGLVLLLDYLDLSVRTPDDLERRLGLPVLGIIPMQPQVAGGVGITPAATPERIVLMSGDGA